MKGLLRHLTSRVRSQLAATVRRDLHQEPDLQAVVIMRAGALVASQGIPQVFLSFPFNQITLPRRVCMEACTFRQDPLRELRNLLPFCGRRQMYLSIPKAPSQTAMQKRYSTARKRRSAELVHIALLSLLRIELLTLWTQRGRR